MKTRMVVFLDESVLRNKGAGAVAGIPRPAFREYQQGFEVEFRKGIYTEECLWGLGLNERQIKAPINLKANNCEERG